MLLTAYYDESGTHAGSPCTVLAGLVASVDAWAAFEWEWSKVLRKHKINHLRAKHLYHRQGQHKGWNDKQEETLWNDLLYVFQERKDLIISKTILMEEDYVRSYRADPLPKERFDSRYGLCLRSCLSVFAASQYAVNPLGSVNYVLELGHHNAGDARRVFDEFKKERESTWGKSLGTISFGAKKDVPALQAADFIAYWAYKTECDILAGDLEEGESSWIEDLLVELEISVARHIITPRDLAILRQNFLVKKKKFRALEDAVLRVNSNALIYSDERYRGFPIELAVSAEELSQLPAQMKRLNRRRRSSARSQ